MVSEVHCLKERHNHSYFGIFTFCSDFQWQTVHLRRRKYDLFLPDFLLNLCRVDASDKIRKEFLFR